MILSNSSNLISFLLANFVWKSKAPSKVKTFACLVVRKKVNTHYMLQMRRTYKSLNPHSSVAILCKGSRKSIDHLFLHCLITLGDWHKLFSVANLDWVPPKSIGDMMIISFRGLQNSIRGKTLWQIACLTIPWIVLQERNVRIFEEKYKTKRMLWDLLHFYSSF